MCPAPAREAAQVNSDSRQGIGNDTPVGLIGGHYLNVLDDGPVDAFRAGLFVYHVKEFSGR